MDSERLAKIDIVSCWCTFKWCKAGPTFDLAPANTS